MLCKRKIAVLNSLVPCGQCINCRINKQREWTGRILLEAKYAPRPSAFVTLTFSENHLPNPATVSREDIRIFINRLRKHHRKQFAENLRFFAVGEYGDKLGRPHYHLALFGSDPGAVPQSQYEQSWQRGFVHVGEITKASAQYIAHYTTKKLTKDNSTAESQFCYMPGIQGEFATMSRYPPIGARGAEHMVELYRTRAGKLALENNRLAYTFEHEGRRWPIGRYWRNWIMSELGINEDQQRSQVNYKDLPIIPRSQINGEEKTQVDLNRAIRRSRATRTL
ncbi:replication initiator protein [Microviridae sp.]|nr:replication initiator protein [Microviridae sp.]